MNELLMLCLYISGNIISCAGSVVLTQTHPVAPYVCRTGNITLRCQYGGVQGVSSVVWLIGLQTTTNPSTIPGHTALPHTTTHQEIVVDNSINLATGYRCEPTFSNGSQLRSPQFVPRSSVSATYFSLDSHIPIQIYYYPLYIVVCFLLQVELMMQN